MTPDRTNDQHASLASVGGPPAARLSASGILEWKPGTWTARDYEWAADHYLRSLPLEHFMEATPQATQREITLESLAVLKTRLGDIQYFNELLVQYPFEGQVRPVVPDNLLIRTSGDDRVRSSYAVELEPVPPFLVLEYVSPSSKRMDYEESFQKYERELKVPYCLLFYPEKQDLRIYHHDGERYVRMEPDADGRCLIAELDLHVGLFQRWVRFWHQGQLLEVPAELLRRLEQMAEQLKVQTEQLKVQTEQLKVQTEQLIVKDNQIGQLHNQLASQTEQSQHSAQRLQQVLDRLRRRVEQRARQAGRNDILEQLPTTTDEDQLDRWLTELD